jgi:hypothetical protein
MSYIYVIAFLSLAFLLAGLSIFFGLESLIRIERMEGKANPPLSKLQRITVSFVLIFAGSILGLTSYSEIVKNDPYWFLDIVFKMFR